MPVVTDRRKTLIIPSVKLWHLTFTAGCRAVTGLVPRALFMEILFFFILDF